MIRKKIIAAVLLLLLCNATQCKDISCIPRSCRDLHCYRRSLGKDGPHIIFPGLKNMPETFRVVCDNLNDGGGWIYIMRRDLLYNVTNFNVSLEQFKHGIGHMHGAHSEFYMGHELIHLLTETFPKHAGTGKDKLGGELRFEGMTYYGASMLGLGEHFHLGSTHHGYRWYCGREHFRWNSANKLLNYHNGRPFGYGNMLCMSDYGHQPFWFVLAERCARMYPFGTIVVELDPFLHRQHMWSMVSGGFYGGTSTILKAMYWSVRPYKEKPNSAFPCHNPCLHGGTCMYEAATDTHYCVCHKDYCGLICEKARSDCKHGGICVYIGEDDPPFCTCAHTHCGPTCETPNPCKNNVSCTYENDKASCTCPPGIFGTHCEVASNCSNGGTPTYNPEDGTFECLCPSTHCGDYCEEIECGFTSDPCLGTPCKNGGTCKYDEDANKFSCACTKYYRGPACMGRTRIKKKPKVPSSHHKKSVGYTLFIPLLLLLAIFVIGCIGIMWQKHREEDQEKPQEVPQKPPAKKEEEEAGLLGYLGF